MKLKEWKHRLRTEKYDIPDIYERIKPYAYRRQQKTEQVSLNPLKKKFVFAPLYVLLFVIALTIFTTDNNYRDNFLLGDYYLSYFSDTSEISEYIKENYEENKLYELDYRKSNNFTLFKVEQNLFDMRLPEHQQYTINEYLEEAITVQAQNNFIFTVSPKALNIIDARSDKLNLVYTKRLASNNSGGIAEMHFTEDYLTVIYTEFYLGEQEIEKITKVITLDKHFNEIYEYSVAGNYLDSYLIKNKLYIFNQIPLNVYLNNNSEIPLPEIWEKNLQKEINASNIAYISGFGGEAYTIITCLELQKTITSEEVILLSYDDWKQFYLSENSLYLINNHQNSDDKLEYGAYTAIIRYNLKGGLNYSTSVKFKGNTLNKGACDEYNGYFRIAISVVDYKITKNLIQTKIVPADFTNKILVLKETGTRTKQMKLISSYDISKNEHLAGVRFDGPKAHALTTNDRFYQISLNNPSQPRLENIIEGENSNLFFCPLNENIAFTINADSTTAGYKLNFYSVDSEGIRPWMQESFKIKYSDFSYFPVIEAINNRNAIFTANILGKYYLGFAVTNFNLSKGEYLLFEINPETETFKQTKFEFSEGSYPIRIIVNENNKKIFALNNTNIASYDNNFEQTEIIEFPN
ncbi:MAG TPA: hypothetical protein GX692_04915 [Acholeplasmataceae bacterium]|nr:hypothetical protein [Acholeplasmataceae bacterium]